MLKQNNKFFIKVKDLINNKYIKGFIDLLSIFILIKFIMSFLIPIKEVISYNFYNHFDYNYQVNIVQDIIYSHTILLYTPIFLCLMSIIKKRIGLREFVISLLLSLCALKFNWFDLVHHFLEKTPIFNLLKENGRIIINNQYTRIIFYVIGLSILFFHLLRKKTRTLSRIIVFLVASSCLFTVTVFHIAIPMGMFKGVQKDKSEIAEYEIKNYPKEVVCATKNCYEISQYGKIKIINEVEELESLNEYTWIIEKGNSLMRKDNKDTFAQAVNVKSKFLFEYNILAIKKEKDGFFVSIDTKSMRKFSRESEITFAFLTTLAHFIWIFGGLLLLEFHYYKFDKRRKIEEK